MNIKENYYTHAHWQVKKGKTEEFILAWKRFGKALSGAPDSPPLQGTLIQSLADPHNFYSFGPWENLEDISAVRNNEKVNKAMDRLKELCVEASPGSYKTVMRLAYPGTRK